MRKESYQTANARMQSGKSVTIKTLIPAMRGSLSDLQTTLHTEDAKQVYRPQIIQGSSLSFLEPIANMDRLILLGGGHIALPLCEFAAKTGFHVTVVDDRPEFSNPARFPAASATICDAFPHAIGQLNITARDYVAVITRGHRYDADCLRAILDGAARPHYLGMIGSRRRVKGLFEMLEAEGYGRDDLDGICSPIGLPIGGVLPEEIAVSILAELIQYKRKNSEKSKVVTSDLDLEMIPYLASLEEPSALVTVLETKGSTPRGAGAKMAVDLLGSVTGSIGGGCAEKDIVHAARALIGTGRYQIETIDMTGDVAESEGMVCGGTMTVLLEDFS